MKTKPSLSPFTSPAKVGVLIFALLAAAGSVQATLVINGGFEDPVISSSTSQIDSMPGWTLDPTSVGSKFEVWGSQSTPYEGIQHIEMNTNGTTSISQNLVTTPGEIYQLTFAYAPRPTYAINILNVYWDGSLLGTLTASGVGSSDTIWKVAVYDVMASGTSTRLAFDDLDETNPLPGGMHLDAVRVVPEVSGSALLAYAAVALLCLRRRGGHGAGW